MHAYVFGGYVSYIIDVSLAMCSGFGEIAVMYESKRSATVIASSSVKLWKMERSVYQAIKLAYTKHVEKQKRKALDSVTLLMSLPDVRAELVYDIM